ncbi:hypothetical protein [Pseudorhodoplanes sp.]|uniref:hypothetical protein n=1 Tax=Pseudorhodoplanes sp. TaxID=1934341 RepID=UPI003D0DEF35
MASKRTTPMACAMNDETIRTFLSNIRERLDKTAATAKAAEACAIAGNVEQALHIVFDVEQPLCEVTTFLNAASLMNRTSRS